MPRSKPVGPTNEHRDRSRGFPRISLVAFLAYAGFLIGALLITAAYNEAAVGRSHYALFWEGMIVGITPAALIAVSRRTSRGMRVGLLLGVEALTALPKFLLSMHGPISADEDSHFRELIDTIRTGHLFTPNATEPINQNFPGLEATSAAIHSLSGIGTWQCAEITVFLAHCLTPLLVFLIAERLKIGPIVPTLAAIVYMSNPSYMFFDNEYAYETLGIALLLITLLCQVGLIRAKTPREAIAFTILGSLTGAATVATHHLSAAVLILFMFVILVLLWPRQKRKGRHSSETAAENNLSELNQSRFAWEVPYSDSGKSKTTDKPNDGDNTVRYGRRCAVLQFSSILLVLLAWFTFVAPSTYSHLSPFLTGGFSQVGAATGVVKSTSTATTVRRTLLHASTLPPYEIYSIRAFPIVAAGICAIAGFFWWLRHKRPPARLLVVFILALLYFVSLPFDLTVAGASGAHRSWSFSFIFLAIAFGYGLQQLATLTYGSRMWAKLAVGLIVVVVITTAFAGNISANTNADGRFGGPYKWGVENREPTPETAALAHWFNTDLPEGARVMTDAYTGMYLYSRSNAVTVPPQNFNVVVDFFYGDRPIPNSVRNDAVSEGYEYIVVDKRLSNHYGVWNSPFLGVLGNLLPQPNTLTRFRSYPWTPLIYNSTDYSVYRINKRALAGST